MKYISTRGGVDAITGGQAVIKGIASDGGLYVPTEIPKLAYPLERYSSMTYKQIAASVLGQFFPEFTSDEMKMAVDKAYDGKFDVPELVELKKVDDMYLLELFHGPTLAFKDMALSFLPELMNLSLQKEGKNGKIIILTATSGDTGKAALAGFKNKDGISIMVFYPEDGVSDLQRLQMTTEDGENCFVGAIKGNFDDAQTAIKTLFNDRELEKQIADMGYSFSAANSINIGRLTPQIVYYVYSYAKLVRDGNIKNGDKINVVVPTGNFGNILAAYYAKEMGLPINKFICASNDNNVLFDFFETGEYNRNRDLVTTTSPSMDILISSNLERLLYEVAGRDTGKVKELMDNLGEDGVYTISDDVKKRLCDFYGSYSTEQDVKDTIRGLFDKTGYLVDTHTAVAVNSYIKYKNETGDNTPSVIASTASPFKFSSAVCDALGIDISSADFYDQSKMISEKAKISLPEQVEKLKNSPVRFTGSYSKDEMRDVVLDFLK